MPLSLQHLRSRVRRSAPGEEALFLMDAQERKSIVERATVPEHGLSLMQSVSGGEPVLAEDFLCFVRNDWIVVVGYPLSYEGPGREFSAESLGRILERFNPGFASVMGPRIPDAVPGACRERRQDAYYTVSLEGFEPGGAARRAARRAAKEARVERARIMGEEHRRLTLEFICRASLPHRAQDLLWKMPRFVAGSGDSLVLNARDARGTLLAFWVVDLEPGPFSTYVIGCHSRRPYVPGASDLLCNELIEVSRERGKRFVHLGLGLSPGLRRFKEKWGGVPGPDYEEAEFVLRRPSLLDAIRGAILP